jgi:hypothetical protein
VPDFAHTCINLAHKCTQLAQTGIKLAQTCIKLDRMGSVRFVWTQGAVFELMAEDEV